MLDEVKKLLNLKLSKPTEKIEKTDHQEADNIVDESVMNREETEQDSNQEAPLEENLGMGPGEEAPASSNLPPLEGLGSMENLLDDKISFNEPDALEFGNGAAEENREIINDFNPSDKQLEELNLQEDPDLLAEELPELDVEIAEQSDNITEDYDHGKVIELTEDDQIFDLELDLDNNKAG